MKSSNFYSALLLAIMELCIVSVPSTQAQVCGKNDSLSASAGGYLWNRAWQYASLSKFKGDIRDSIADAPLIRQVLFEAQSAQTVTNVINVAKLQLKTDSCWKYSNQMLLTHFAAPINRFNDSSVFSLQNWDTAQSRFVYPKNYFPKVFTDTLCVFGSLNECVDRGDFKLLFDSSFDYSQWSNNFQYFVAVDDTLNFLPLSNSSSLSIQIDTNNTVHHLYFKAVGFTTQYSCYTFTYQKNTVVFPPPDLIVPINASLMYNGVAASGELGVWKSCLNTVGFNQPVIIVEGFDPQNNRGLLSSNSASNNLYCISNASVLHGTNILDSLRAYGHDVLIMNFNDGGTYVERNAFALVSAINYVNANVEGNDELMIVGASMGGLISRYALTYMERNNLNHHCRLWVSFDSPHKGANVPIGLQMMIDFIYDNLSKMPYAIQKQIPALRDEVLNCPAAREMLLMHYSELKKGNFGACPEFNNLYDTLNSWGFPNCRKIAFSDGNHSGGDQGFNVGQNLINLNLPLYPVFIKMSANAMPLGSKSASIFDGEIWVNVKGIPVSIVSKHYKVSTGNGIDNAAGGSNSFHMDVAKSLGLHHSQNTLGTCLMEEDNFVPVSSSLAINAPMNYQTPLSVLMPSLSYLGRTHTNAISTFDACYSMKNYYSSSRNSTLNNAPHIVGGFDLNMMHLVQSEVMSRQYYLQNQTWNSTHEVEAQKVVAGSNVSSVFLTGDFICSNNAKAEVKAVDKIELKAGVQLLHPQFCHFAIVPSLFDKSCINVVSTQSYRQVKNVQAQVAMTYNTESNLDGGNGLITLSPNPSNGTYWVHLKGLDNVVLRVFDIAGKEVLYLPKFVNGDEIDLQNEPDGLYFLQVQNPQFLTVKIIKQSL